MSRLEKQIAEEIAEWNRLSGINTVRVVKKKATDLDEDTRKLIIAGGYIAEFFPQILQFQPQSTEDENHVEYARLTAFLVLLVDDREYVGSLLNRVEETLKSG